MANSQFNMNAMLGQFQQFMQNPGVFMAQRRFNLPNGFEQNPSGAIQQLLNSGQMSQEQYNQLRQMADQLQNNPQFMQMFRR